MTAPVLSAWVLLSLAGIGALDAFYVSYFLAGAYRWREILSNFFTMLVCEALRRASLPAKALCFFVLYELSPLKLAVSWSWLLLCYLLVDFLYYWKHRWLHETELGWALHSTHHSSRELDVSTGMRTNWIQRLIEDFFFAPLCLLGFHPLVVLVLVEVNLFSLVWVHTRVRGPWRHLEPWLNTPAAHRVHHGSVHDHAHCNYGATLLIWDRLFGTYRREPDVELVYGVQELEPGLNPLRVQFLGLWRYAQRKWARTSATPRTH
ncbi:MAG: sterol desaturase family protein [Myxococcaceae bacterium]